MKYFKNKINEIKAFDVDVDVELYIDLKEWESIKESDVKDILKVKETSLILPSLTKRQFNLYLYDNGLYESVNQSIESNPRFKIEFDSVAVIERNSETVKKVSELLNLSDEDIDKMWIEALEI